MPFIRLLVAITLGLGLAACEVHVDPIKGPNPCVSDEVCSEGIGCNFGFCQGRLCETDADCSEGDECLEGESMSLCRMSLGCGAGCPGTCTPFVEGEPNEICVSNE